MNGSHVTLPCPKLPTGPRLALVIAASQYDDLSLRALRAPAADAMAVADVLGDPDIGSFRVTSIIDRGVQELRQSVDDFLSGRSPDEFVVVYLSCHGITDSRRRLYFAAADTKKTRLASTGLASSWVLDRLDECRARKQVLILDCCFSGAFAQGRKGPEELDLHSLVDAGRGRAVLTASNAVEYSFEHCGDQDPLETSAPSESVFTRALLEGLRTGAADKDGNGYITVDEAYTYAREQVRARGAAQTPQRWLSAGEGDLLLARNPMGRTAVPADLPHSLREALDNPSPDVRIGAVAELTRWLASVDRAHSISAERELEAVIAREIPRVAEAARKALQGAKRTAVAATFERGGPTSRDISPSATTTPIEHVEKVRPTRMPLIFEVAISRLQSASSPNEFSVEVIRSPTGVCASVAKLDSAELLAQRESIEQEVMRSSLRTRGAMSLTPHGTLQEVGRILFGALLGNAPVAGCYRAATALAAERRERLRIVIQINDAELDALPWEAIYDDILESYVCRREPLVRQLPTILPPAPLRVEPPLRVLGIVSSPRDLAPLDVAKERDGCEQALALPISRGSIELHWLERATWAGLLLELMNGPWHVIHFIGHGAYLAESNGGVLALESDAGRLEMVEANRFVDLLSQADPTPRLVLLNSCSGAGNSTADRFNGTAATLIRGGISAVVAMQYDISDEAAIAFSRGFYSAIAVRRGIDQAVSAGRVAILGTSPTTLEWVTPVFYLRGEETHLFSSL
jgi:hypothetical protein